MNPLTFHLYANAQQYNNTLNNAVQLSNRITNTISNNMRTIYNSSMRNDQSVRNVGNTTYKIDQREGMGQRGGSTAGMIARYTGVYLALRGIEQLTSAVVHQTIEWGKHTIQLAANYERTKIAFEVMVGDAKRGTELLGSLTNMAIKSPFVVEDLTKAAQMLLGMGVNVESIMPTVERLGDIAAGDAEKLRRLTLAFGQVGAAGRFMGTELRQFTEAGVGAGDFAKAMGLTTSQFRKQMHDGAIGVDGMIKGINMLTERGGRFYQMNERQNKTVLGQWNSLKETIDQVLRVTGVNLFEKYDVAGKLGKLRDWATDNLAKYVEQIVGVLEVVGTKLQDAMMEIFEVTNFQAAWDELKLLGVSTFEAIVVAIKVMVPAIVTAFRILSPLIRALEFSVTGLAFAVGGLRAGSGALIYGAGFKEFGAELYGQGKMMVKGAKDALMVQGDMLFDPKKQEPKQIRMADYMTKEGVYKFPSGSHPGLQFGKEYFDALSEGMVLGQKQMMGGTMMRRTLEGWETEGGKLLIPIELNFHPAVRKMAEAIQKEFGKGMSPYEEFSNEMANLITAAKPIIDKQGFIKQAPLLNQDQFNFGAAERFRNLEKSLKQKEMQLPKALYFGSGETQDAVNEAQYQKLESTEEKVLRVLEETEKTGKLQLEEDKKIADILEKTFKKPPAIKKGV